MTPTADLQSEFTRAVEAEYDQRAARYRGAGLEPEAAHARALEETKALARKALEELRRRGAFPWPTSGTGSEVGSNVH